LGRLSPPRAAVAAVLLALLALPLSGCSSGYDGTGTSACPALPGDVVAAVAGDLSADGAGPEPREDRPESGALPPSGDGEGGVLYRCQWATTDGGTGLQVYLRTSDETRVAADEAYLRQQDGPELSAPVSGYGRAFVPGGSGAAQARWLCDARELQVDLFSPKDGTDPVAGAARLTTAIAPKLGCPAQG
jgi:hypothetical protein